MLLSMAALGTGSAYAQEAGGVIDGVVFVDQDADGVRDPGESGLPEVVIILTNDRVTYQARSGFDGSFRFTVGPGSWRATVELPEGYVVLNDDTRQVLIGEERVAEAVLDFALGAAPSGGSQDSSEVQQWQGPPREAAAEGLPAGVLAPTPMGAGSEGLAPVGLGVGILILGSLVALLGWALSAVRDEKAP
jgi:hypothetical protein